MNPACDDLFVVFVRDRRRLADFPEAVEQEVASCATYAEARRVWRSFHAAARECVIRYVGPAGGSD